MAELAKKRNLVLCGHGGAGKTSLAESLLHKAKVTNRWGKVDDGTSHLDTGDDEKERKSSVHAAIASFEYDGHDVTIIDTPGYPDFIGEVYSCMHAVETALIVIGASDGIGVNTRKCWEMAEETDRARGIVVTKVDGEHVNVEEILGKIRAAFGDRCIPINYPLGQGGSLDGVCSVLEVDAAPADVKDQVAQFRTEAVEAAVEADDSMMETYLEAGDISDEQLFTVMPLAMAQRTFTPIFFTSMPGDMGFKKLLDSIAGYFPSPANHGVIPPASKDDEAVEVAVDGPFLAQCFRVQNDVVGKRAFVRVWGGSAETGSQAKNVRVGKGGKLGEFQRVVGKESTGTSLASAGDIVVLPKVDTLQFGDTLSSGDDITFEPVNYPLPMVALAISPKSRNDETKLGEALHKLTDEDPTFIAKFDDDTKELVARGISELHLQLMLKALKDRYKVEVDTRAPKIPYRETITSPVDAHHRHKKQTGGAGQFGEVYIKIEPTERGTGFEFVDEIVGGVIPNVFIPAVEKGIREKMDEGIVAGYPVVDLRVRLYDGKHHPVDSKEVAFKTAGREAIKKAVKDAKPKLLEPVVDLTVQVPSQFMGDVTGDLNGRRGRVMGMDSEGDQQIVKAQVPMSEVQSYSATLRSMTGGEGSFTIEFSHYDIVPNDAADKVIAAYKDDDEES